jgi:hypothetical protein
VLPGADVLPQAVDAGVAGDGEHHAPTPSPAKDRRETPSARPSGASPGRSPRRPRRAPRSA